MACINRSNEGGRLTIDAPSDRPVEDRTARPAETLSLEGARYASRYRAIVAAEAADAFLVIDGR